MNQSQKKNDHATKAGKPESKQSNPKRNQNDAKARGLGETAAANSSNPKDRSPRQENL